ncbi:organic hydroperoxide resistance protein [Amorphus orientalis]|uniref:Ohr subfamily peroxiredoxin n=1 Tax=Amorphus orientalis TaxID=649198 RepID=A0AAE3VKR6_9HYPH|nr:organic hydroperoxide resistance protein [Amorphus orientalis]MDQ0313954.1 Ohr subfamily peroxiredoxin [Amorphus orientalis]
MSALYSTTVTAHGGRNGTARSDDGILDLSVAMPKSLGGAGGATNPEQLFAAGYAACFGSAVIHTARSGPHKLEDDAVTVEATVGLNAGAGGGFALSVDLSVTIAGVDQGTAEEIVEKAHQTCPYSNAVRGNVDVGLKVTAR